MPKFINGEAYLTAVMVDGGDGSAIPSSKPFCPVPGSTLSIAVTATSSAAVAVTAGEVLRFSNSVTAPIGIVFGTSTVVAAFATAMEILPGTAESFTVPAGATHFAAIMASGTGTLKYTRGTGA